MARKDKPLRGNGNDSVDYGAFIKGVLDGSNAASALIDTTVPNGTRDVLVSTFVVDPQGTVEIPDGLGGKVRGRFDVTTLTIPARRLTKLEYD